MMDPPRFRSLLGRFASGITVVTTCDRGTDHGITVSAFCSLSLEPPLVLICIEQRARIHEVLLRATHFAVNVLAAHQEDISRRFAERPDDRFDGLGYTRGLTGTPILEGILAYIECEIRSRHAGGDHTIFVGEVIAGTASDDRPLLYYRGGYAQLER